MERPLSPKELDERVAELEERVARRVDERIVQAIADFAAQQSES